MKKVYIMTLSKVGLWLKKNLPIGQIFFPSAPTSFSVSTPKTASKN